MPRLADFYVQDRRRLRSKERDYGLLWREGNDGEGGPLYRAAWVRETGELYVVRLGSPEQGGGDVEVLAVQPDPDALDAALEGWRDACGEPDGMSWLRERAVRAGFARTLAAAAG